MKVSKWIDFGQEVEVEITTEDICAAIGEAFSAVTEDRLGEPGASRGEVIRAFNVIGNFLTAVTDEHINQLLPAQRELVGKYLATAARRF